jgi:hypothetical protein
MPRPHFTHGERTPGTLDMRLGGPQSWSWEWLEENSSNRGDTLNPVGKRPLGRRRLYGEIMLRLVIRYRLWGQEVDVTGLGSCSVATFGVSVVEHLSSVARNMEFQWTERDTCAVTAVGSADFVMPVILYGPDNRGLIPSTVRNVSICHN